MIRALGLLVLLAAPAMAQDIQVQVEEPQPYDGLTAEEYLDQTTDGIEGATTDELRVTQGQGARLKALDKINGDVSEFDMPAGGSVRIGKLVVALNECRYPEDDPEGDAFAYLVISEPAKSPDPIYSGWMIASSPALNALDHFRYDIWVLRCTTS